MRWIVVQRQAGWAHASCQCRGGAGQDAGAYPQATEKAPPDTEFRSPMAAPVSPYPASTTASPLMALVGTRHHTRHEAAGSGSRNRRTNGHLVESWRPAHKAPPLSPTSFRIFVRY
jgi:hypothetical protein